MGSNALDDRRAGTDVVLTNLSIGIPTDQDFIGDQLLPPLPVPVSKVKVPVWGNEAFRIREDRLGDFSEPEKLDISVSTTLIEVDGHGQMAPVSDRQRQEAARGALKYDLDLEALQTVVASMDLSREKQQADLVTSPAVYGATHKQDQNGLARLWSDPTIDPLDDLIPMMESIVPDDSGKRPNTFWMGQPVWAALLVNPKLRARAYGTVGPVPMLNTAKFADLIGLDVAKGDKVLVGRAISRTEGGAITKLWGKNAGLVYVPPTAGKRVPAFGYTVEETVFGTASETVKRVRDEKMGASGGEWLIRGAFYTPILTFVNAGSLFYNAVA